MVRSKLNRIVSNIFGNKKYLSIDILLIFGVSYYSLLNVQKVIVNTAIECFLAGTAPEKATLYRVVMAGNRCHCIGSCLFNLIPNTEPNLSGLVTGNYFTSSASPEGNTSNALE